ncbi:hypothetical protein [Lysobacter sp. 22409]|uniref:hypothetical protein n=1 Tax=Lysobacter sp. 22409 TaxID=3453917 RepID=UPI003F852379
MGGAKKAMQEHQDKLARALLIAVEAGSISTCEMHGDVYLEGKEVIESAYKPGNSKYSAGELDGVLESRREMTVLIMEAVNENSSDECYCCAKFRDE